VINRPQAAGTGSGMKHSGHRPARISKSKRTINKERWNVPGDACFFQTKKIFFYRAFALREKRLQKSCFYENINIFAA
jgi:hypothetical protein